MQGTRKNKPQLKVESLASAGKSVSLVTFFKINVCRKRELYFPGILLPQAFKTLLPRHSAELNNALKKNLAYRNFVVYMNRNIPMGRHNRVVLSRCVVLKVRQAYPDAHRHNLFILNFL